MKIANVISPIIVLLVGVAVAVGLVTTAREPERTAPEPLPTRVDVLVARKQRLPIRVRGMGTVEAARRTALRPEVSGRIRSVHPRLRPGRVFDSGEVLVSIDARDFDVRVTEAKSALAQRKLELEEELGRQRVAKRELELLGRGDALTDEERSLTLRVPHLAQARAAVEGAEASLRKAELDLARTRLRAPYLGFVSVERAEVGNVVGASGEPLVEIVGADAFWVRLSVPVSALRWLRAGDEGSRATIRQVQGDQTVRREGRVIEILPELDDQGRQGQVLIRVDDPLHLERPEGDRSALLLGAYVETQLEGDAADAAVIPRVALRQGRQVWIMNAEDQLEVRDIETVWRGRSEVYVSRGVDDGERVITSRIAAPMPGIELRLGESTNAAPAAAM